MTNSLKYSQKYEILAACVTINIVIGTYFIHGLHFISF